jgi:transposase
MTTMVPRSMGRPASFEIRDDLNQRGIEAVIPPRSSRKTLIEYDREAYKRRNVIKRCVYRLKQFSRITTRYEKTARREQ